MRFVYKKNGIFVFHIRLHAVQWMKKAEIPLWINYLITPVSAYAWD